MIRLSHFGSCPVSVAAVESYGLYVHQVKYSLTHGMIIPQVPCNICPIEVRVRFFSYKEVKGGKKEDYPKPDKQPFIFSLKSRRRTCTRTLPTTPVPQFTFPSLESWESRKLHLVSVCQTWEELEYFWVSSLPWPRSLLLFKPYLADWD